MAVTTAWTISAGALPPAQRRMEVETARRGQSSLLVSGATPRRTVLRSDRPSAVSISCHSGRSSGSGDCGSTSCSDWDWSRWSRHFSEVDQADNLVSVLKFQLEDAIEKEDFMEAARIKTALTEAISKDAVAEVMSELKNAVEEERYHDASRLCRITESGMVGWWAGWSKNSDDPFGKIVRVTPAIGRFVAKSYSPRQLLNGSSGTSLFEIFLVKDDDGSYVSQVVYLQPLKGNSSLSLSSTSDSSDTPSKPKTEHMPVEDISADDNSLDISSRDNSLETGDTNSKDSSEERIKSLLNFFKERLPGFKIKVLNVSDPEEIKVDAKSLEHLVQEEIENDVAAENSTNDESSVDDIQQEDTGNEDVDSTGESKNSNVKLYFGGIHRNKDDIPLKSYSRFPAELKNKKKDSFVLHIPGKITDPNFGDRKAAKIKFAAIAAQADAQADSDLMSPDFAKTFWDSDIPAKASKEVREVIKLAVCQSQRRSKLSKVTTFNRIVTDDNNLDPFNGLYVGSFGPYGFEVVQLERKYGCWNTAGNASDDLELEFFEYVEAVKLTGDLNVPAGQVTFRAKIGKGSRLPDRGYPPELGVVASYKGQGRIAESGFKNPKWVDGELVLLSGKGFGPLLRGAELGFLYVVPEHGFLVLFHRLGLPQ